MNIPPETRLRQSKQLHHASGFQCYKDSFEVTGGTFRKFSFIRFTQNFPQLNTIKSLLLISSRPAGWILRSPTNGHMNQRLQRASPVTSPMTSSPVNRPVRWTHSALQQCFECAGFYKCGESFYRAVRQCFHSRGQMEALT